MTKKSLVFDQNSSKECETLVSYYITFVVVSFTRGDKNPEEFQ